MCIFWLCDSWFMHHFSRVPSIGEWNWMGVMTRELKSNRLNALSFSMLFSKGEAVSKRQYSWTILVGGTACHKQISIYTCSEKQRSPPPLRDRSCVAPAHLSELLLYLLWLASVSMSAWISAPSFQKKTCHTITMYLGTFADHFVFHCFEFLMFIFAPERQYLVSGMESFELNLHLHEEVSNRISN
jgi:hypothetical protein